MVYGCAFLWDGWTHRMIFLVFCPHCFTWQVKLSCNNWLHHMLMFGTCMKFSFGWVNHGMILFIFHPHCGAWKEKTPLNLQVFFFFGAHVCVFSGWVHHRKIPFFHPHCWSWKDKIITQLTRYWIFFVYVCVNLWILHHRIIPFFSSTL